MLIRYPAKIKPKQQVNKFTLNLDIAPTLLDYAGITIPADMQGASIRPLLQKGKVRNWRSEIYYHYYELSFGLTRHYGIYTGRYKLIHFYNPIDAWELYDLKKDKLEMNNVYDDPKYAKTIKELKEHLLKLQQYYKDDMKQ
jgi:arylsulfatase A-like enzyme